MPRRLLALVASVAMVAGAFAVRGWLDRRGEDKANPPGLVCVTELADFCRLIAEQTDVNVTVQPPNDTATRMTAQGGAGDIDGWLTLSHWPAIAEARRTNRGLPNVFTSADNPVLARARVGLAVWPDRAGVLNEACANQIQWKCLGDVAQKRAWRDVPSRNPAREAWGPIKLGLPDATASAVGLAAFGAATTGYFGRPDVSTIDFDDDGYRAWAGALVDATPAQLPDFTRVLAQGPSLQDVYAGTEAELGAPLATYARPDKPTLIYPSPVATADVVLAVVPGRAGERLREIVQDRVEELMEAGWRQPFDPALPRNDDGLPDPGVLDALQQVWKEAA